MPHEITRTECRCTRRQAAQAMGDFVYLPHSKVWVFPEQRRSMSAHARYFAFSERSEHPHTDHTGEHYGRVECPWCGHELPYCHEPRIVWPLTDGDGTE